jgi:hypothetical protein
MELVIGVVIGIAMHKYKDKVADLCVKIVDKVKGVFKKE